MLQMTIHRPAAPPARRTAPAASFARACAAAVCAAALLAGTPWALAAQGAPPAPPATNPPAATPPAAAPGQQLFPGESGTLKGLETPPAKPAPAAPGQQLFPGESGTLKGVAPPPAKPAPAAPPPPAAPEGNAETRGLDQDIQGLKKDVVDLNKDLFILEEELLFPANTQLAVFLSMDVGDFFALDSVQLKLDQKEVINYLYTPGRYARAGRLLQRHRTQRARLPARLFPALRKGRRRQVSRAQDQRSAAQTRAGVRDQGLGIDL